jgi:hypothetical protein
MRRSMVTVGAVVLGLVAFTPGAAGAAPASVSPTAAKAAPNVKPAEPNPFLALVPDATKVDYRAWAEYMSKNAAAKAAARLKAQARNRVAVSSPLLVDEDEPDGTRGSNDDPASAQRITGFGTGANQNPALRILGSLDPAPVEEIGANAEDDGSIPLAGDTGIGAGRTGISVDATIGDGPHGSAGDGTGDFDFYHVTANAGDVIIASTDTPTGDLDTMLAVYTADGTLVAFNDDANDLDSRVSYTVPDSGEYYVAVTGYPVLPEDPMNSGSGTGLGSEGPYTLTITVGGQDRDFFAVRLRAGDVLGATVKGAATYLTVYDTVPREVHGSDQDATYIYPPKSLLPGGGNATTDYVATRTGWHYVGVTNGSGSYDITVEAYRPPLQGARPVQTLFLDFDGARVNTGIWGGPGVRQLSPFAAFLARWGIPRASEAAVIDAVVAEVTESIKQDMIDSGLNSRFRLRILNSKDNADPWGQANVSRVVVGGTIDESGIGTIGISQSIDPGNFDTEESALVLLDLLSDPGGPDAPYSLNTYMTSASDRIAFVGQAVGNVTAHEAGHFFGNWHTDNSSPRVNLMDAGGENFQNLFGVGPDQVGGTADDVDVDFGDDAFEPEEGFVGIEDTLGRIVFGVTS